MRNIKLLLILIAHSICLNMSILYTYNVIVVKKNINSHELNVKNITSKVGKND